MAVTTTLNDLCREEESDPGCLTLGSVFAKLLWTWMRVDADKKEEAKSGTGCHGPDGMGDMTPSVMLASLACAAQIVAEKAAKKGTGPGDKTLGPAADEVAARKKDNADLRKVCKQLSDKVDSALEANGEQFKQQYCGKQ